MSDEPFAQAAKQLADFTLLSVGAGFNGTDVKLGLHWYDAKPWNRMLFLE